MKNTIKELTAIRNEMLEDLNNGDTIGVKFQINNLDTLLYKLSQQSEPKSAEEIMLDYTGSSEFSQIKDMKWTTAEVLAVFDKPASQQSNEIDLLLTNPELKSAEEFMNKNNDKLAHYLSHSGNDNIRTQVIWLMTQFASQQSDEWVSVKCTDCHKITKVLKNENETHFCSYCTHPIWRELPQPPK